VGVSWSDFLEERWRRDETAIKKALTKAGVEYISTDAHRSNEQQIKDIDTLINKGAKAIIVLSWDADALLPAIANAKARGVPIIAYDRLIQDKDVFYITFDNIEVGRIQAREILKKKPQGNYAFIKGAATDANADMLFSGQMEVLSESLKAGRIKNIGDIYTDGWSPDNAQKNMATILAKNGNKVDAVIASNDGTAGGAIAALNTANVKGVAISGQDADIAALNRIARGDQVVTVFKDPRKLGDAAGWVASELAMGKKLNQIAGTVQWVGGTKKIPITSLLLRPIPITSTNLATVLSAKWISKPQLCAGVDPLKGPDVCK
ncbi:MAG: substrate-binding domain-containing protein, partial [Pseudomonadota bacterium]